MNPTIARYLDIFSFLQKAIVPNLQNIIIVLLKLLLATVTPYNGANPNVNGHSNGNETSQEKINNTSEINQTVQAHDIEEANNKRNREITSKAVSGILLLLLQWTKLSRMFRLWLFCRNL
jgi:Domain of unknown function (DUF3402)